MMLIYERMSYPYGTGFPQYPTQEHNTWTLVSQLSSLSVVNLVKSLKKGILKVTTHMCSNRHVES
jgi:hypothetical protein